jgi:hypothetical protein
MPNSSDAKLQGLDTHGLLLVIVERTEQLQRDVTAIKVQNAAADERFVRRHEWVEEKTRAEKDHAGFVTRAEFDPVRMVVYGMVGFVLLAVLVAIVGLVVMTAGHSPAKAAADPGSAITLTEGRLP